MRASSCSRRIRREQEGCLIVPAGRWGRASLQRTSCNLDRLEVSFSVAVGFEGNLKPRGLAFAIPTGEVWERRSCRYMLNGLHLSVGTSVKVRISADRGRRTAA